MTESQATPDHISWAVYTRSCTNLDIEATFPCKSYRQFGIYWALAIISTTNFHVYPEIITKILIPLSTLNGLGIQVILDWVSSHVNLKSNDHADKLANEPTGLEVVDGDDDDDDDWYFTATVVQMVGSGGLTV